MNVCGLQLEKQNNKTEFIVEWKSPVLRNISRTSDAPFSLFQDPGLLILSDGALKKYSFLAAFLADAWGWTMGSS